MQKRRLGADGPEISALGYGLMSLSSTYGPSEDEESLTTIHRALDLGIDFLDTAEIYGMGHNEMLIGEALKSRSRDNLQISVKFGALRDRNYGFLGYDSRPAATAHETEVAA